MSQCPSGSYPLPPSAVACSTDEPPPARGAADVLALQRLRAGIGEYLVHSWHPDFCIGSDGGRALPDRYPLGRPRDPRQPGRPLDETRQRWSLKAWFLEGTSVTACTSDPGFVCVIRGRWVYTDGEQDPAPLRGLVATDPCPCGSGKKFKRCCG